ncbi:hypothetical protein H9625_12125 [Phocaeicola sp. Sa1CVN1]|uniref:Uncharacterized protein n=1 Tax=Phocaeicola intestinalis TaxID=2762212 RepID=A0ABR8YAS4_9BACT|nr:hypothetical protein [Phocaeicola intestinalis]MBD8041169.1 hypothetical protein [Phocaeicola intestinalis]
MALLPSDVLAKGGSCSWETVEAGAGLCPIGLAALRGEAWGIAGRCPTVVTPGGCLRCCPCVGFARVSASPQAPARL